MRALVIKEAGSLDGVAIDELPAPTPAEGEVLISVSAVTVNPADWKILGLAPPVWKLPMAAGLDCAGAIAAVGENVSDWAEGDRVVFHSSFLKLGTYAELVAAPAHVISRIPETVSMAQAAALPTASYTAFQFVEDRLHLRSDQSVLIHAAAGGVGGAAVQLARRRGATVIGTCSAANFDYVKGLGADHCIDYQSEDIAERVKEISEGRGVDAVINTLSPDVGVEAIPMLAFQGHLATCVGLPDFTKLDPLPRGIQLSDIALGAAYMSGDRKAQERLAYYGDQLLAMVASGDFDPMVSHEWEFDRIIEALELNKTGRQRGKIVLSF